MAFGPLGRGSLLVLCVCLARCGSEAPEEPDTDGDGRVGRQDCDQSSNAHWSDCNTCVDDDGDEHGDGCNLGPDCDDTATTGRFCDSGCFTARRDNDHDGYAETELLTVCAFTGEHSGVDAPTDCDDSDGRHWSDCGACADADDDGRGPGCDQGGDCDDADALCNDGCVALYADDDGDGHGDGSVSIIGCEGHQGFTNNADDCDPTQSQHWSDCGLCSDPDGDHTGPGCNWHESDCDQGNPNVWVSCATCRDPDHDGAFAGCDAYTTVDEDCDERDPLIHPGAVDFPDNGIAEDCDGASEPHAADGVGIYVSSDCGSNEQGTMSAPFCTLTGALAASQQGSFIFVASGQYAMPDTVSSTRIFGGYLAGWTSRSPSRTATSFTNATEFSGAVLDDVLIQHAIYFHTNDCNNCAALTVGNGGARLADFDVAMENTATDCSTVQVSTGDAVLVRVTVRGASCVNHRAVVQNDRDTVVWKSQIQAGSPGNVTQQPTVFWGGGGLTVGESTLAADGARATAIQTFSGAVVDLQSVRIDVEGVDGISGGVAHEGSSLRVVNSLLEVTSTAGTAFPLTVGSGMADIFHTNIEGTGVGATAVQIATTGVVRVINDVLTAVGSAGSYGLNIPNPGSQVSVVTNDFQVSGGGTTCAMLVEGICGDPIGVDGNIQSTGCELPLSTSCTRILAGTGLDDELTPRVDIDYATRFGWDIGAYDLPGPTID